MAIGLRINKLTKINLEERLREKVVELHENIYNNEYLRDDIRKGIEERLAKILANPVIGVAVSNNCSRNPYSGERTSFSNRRLVISHEGYEVPSWENEDLDYLYSLEEEDLVCPLEDHYLEYFKATIRDEKILNLILEKEDEIKKGSDDTFKFQIKRALMLSYLDKNSLAAYVKKYLKKDMDPRYGPEYGILFRLGLCPKAVMGDRTSIDRREAGNKWLAQFEEPAKEIKKEEKETPKETKTKIEVKEQPQKTKAPVAKKFLPFKDGKELKIISYDLDALESRLESIIKFFGYEYDPEADDFERGESHISILDYDPDEGYFILEIKETEIELEKWKLQNMGLLDF